jgi:hypothetical protein
VRCAAPRRSSSPTWCWWGGLGGWCLVQPAARQQDVAALVGNAFDGRKQITAFDVAWDLWQLYWFFDVFSGISPAAWEGSEDAS